MPDNPNDPCDAIKGQAEAYCRQGDANPPPAPDSEVPGGGGLTGGASDNVKDLADWLLDSIQGLLAPEKAWAPATENSVLYAPFLWLGQHLAVAIFTCVVVVCGLTAWQGVPRLRQMGASTGWTLAAVAGMASVPGIVTLLHQAVSNAFEEAFDSNESTFFEVIRRDLETGGDANPLGLMVITAALCVALACAALVFMVRQPGILALVCMAPLVLASLARGGDMGAVKTWTQRLLGLLFAPFALLILLPFVPLAEGELVGDVILLIAADLLMLRMIFHGVPYFGPRVAGAVRTAVERNTSNPTIRAVVRAGVPDTYEHEDVPRGPRAVDTPGRALGQDRDALLAAYGIRTRPRPGRLTTASAAARVRADAERTASLTAARRAARIGTPAAAGDKPAAESAARPSGDTSAARTAARKAAAKKTATAAPSAAAAEAPAAVKKTAATRKTAAPRRADPPSGPSETGAS